MLEFTTKLEHASGRNVFKAITAIEHKRIGSHNEQGLIWAVRADAKKAPPYLWLADLLNLAPSVRLDIVHRRGQTAIQIHIGGKPVNVYSAAWRLVEQNQPVKIGRSGYALTQAEQVAGLEEIFQKTKTFSDDQIAEKMIDDGVARQFFNTSYVEVAPAEELKDAIRIRFLEDTLVTYRGKTRFSKKIRDSVVVARQANGLYQVVPRKVHFFELGPQQFGHLTLLNPGS